MSELPRIAKAELLVLQLITEHASFTKVVSEEKNSVFQTSLLRVSHVASQKRSF